MKSDNSIIQTTELAPNAKWVHEKSAEVQIKQINGHTDSITSCQLINNDQFIFTVSNDNTARIWNFVTGKELNVYENLHDSTIPKAKVSSDNTKFITCSWDRTIKCWDLETGQLLWKNAHDYLISSCAFSNIDSKYALSICDVDFVAKIWDVNSGQLVMSVPDLHKSCVTACGFSPKDDRIITTSADKTTKFFDIVAKKFTISLGGHNSVISNFYCTTDERRVATCSWDKTIKIWDISTGMYRKKGPVVLEKGHEGSVSCCLIPNNGSICVSAGYDARLVLWDIDLSQPKLIFRSHTDWINDICITKDTNWVVSVGKDKGIREWNISNRDNIKQVVEQNKNLGNKLTHCSNCNRLFTQTKLVKTSESKVNCVFCRLQNIQDMLQNPTDSNSDIDHASHLSNRHHQHHHHHHHQHHHHSQERQHQQSELQNPTKQTSSSSDMENISLSN